MNKETKKITIPVSIFNSMLRAQKNWEIFIDELEDFLFSRDRNFVRKMKRARKEHLDNNLSSLSKLKIE